MLKRYVFFPAIWITVLVLWALPTLAEPIVDTAWVRTYNGPGDSSDGATAIAVDGSGNVYVTGGIQVSGSGGDYATILSWFGNWNSRTNLVREIQFPHEQEGFSTRPKVCGYRDHN